MKLFEKLQKMEQDKLEAVGGNIAYQEAKRRLLALWDKIGYGDLFGPFILSDDSQGQQHHFRLRRAYGDLMVERLVVVPFSTSVVLTPKRVLLPGVGGAIGIPLRWEEVFSDAERLQVYTALLGDVEEKETKTPGSILKVMS